MAVSINQAKNGVGGRDLVKIGVLIDSMSVQNAAWEPAWASYFERTLNQNGLNVEVRCFGRNADTFYRANTVAAFGGKTSVQALVAYSPSVVIVMLGVNDAVNPSDSRTLAQIKSDADTTFSALRSGLPTSKIYYCKQQPYDNANFTGATLKNKGAPPNLMALKSSGTLANTYCESILSDNLSSTYRTQFDNYDQFITYIAANSNIDGVCAARAWKICRLGVLSPDGYHFAHAGDALKACAVLSTLKAINAPFLSAIADQLITQWNDIDTILNSFLLASGDGWVAQWPTADFYAPGTWHTLAKDFRINSWYHRYKAQVNFYPLALTNNSAITGQYHWFVRGARPHTTVENALLDHATQAEVLAFTTTGFSTDEFGNAEVTNVIGPLGLPNGSYDFYFRVGDDAFGPFNIVLS